MRHKGKGVSDLFLETINRLIIFLDGVPLVDRNDHALAPLMSNSCNLGILFGHALFRIDDKHDDIGALYRADGADDHITLQLFFNFIFASKTCRINEDVLFSVMHYLGIHRIPRCTCNIGNDHPVFTDQAVNNG